MAAPKFHPSNLLALVVDSPAMEAAKPALDQALKTTLERYQPDMEQAAIVIGATAQGDEWRFDVDVLAVAAQVPELRPVLRTVHMVAAEIFDIFKDAPHDDEAAFDNAVIRAKDVLQKNGIDPRLAVMFVETAMAGIFADAFANSLVMTLYTDGRLLLLKGSLLARLLQAHQRERQGIASQA